MLYNKIDDEHLIFSFEDYKKEYNLDFNLGDEVYIISYRSLSQEIAYPYIRKSKVIDISNNEKLFHREEDIFMLSIQSDLGGSSFYVLVRNIYSNKEKAIEALKDRIKSTEEEVDIYLNTMKTIFLDECKQAMFRAEAL